MVVRISEGTLKHVVLSIVKISPEGRIANRANCSVSIFGIDREILPGIAMVEIEYDCCVLSVDLLE